MLNYTISKVTYYVKPRHKTLWYNPWKSVVVFDVMQYTKGKRWDDPSYGNGGGCFEDFTETRKITTFNNRYSAEYYISQLKIVNNE